MSKDKTSNDNPNEHIDLGRTIPMPSDRIKPSAPPPLEKK